LDANDCTVPIDKFNQVFFELRTNAVLKTILANQMCCRVGTFEHIPTQIRFGADAAICLGLDGGRMGRCRGGGMGRCRILTFRN